MNKLEFYLTLFLVFFIMPLNGYLISLGDIIPVVGGLMSIAFMTPLLLKIITRGAYED